MRLKRGGFTPRIAGRPISEVTTIPLPSRLVLTLLRHGIRYEPVVSDGEEVAFGAPLATAEAAGTTLVLPSPASGRISFDGHTDETRLVIEEARSAPAAVGFRPQQFERASTDAIKDILVRGGIWPFFFSSRNRGIPSFENGAPPRAIAINFILTEPFRARGKVIITRSWDRIVTGIRFLQRLIADYGSIEIVLTDKHDPVARMMYDDLKGFAWVRFHSVPLTYPIENPRLLSSTLRSTVPGIGKGDDIWVIDAQGIAALGACLGEGLPLSERVVVTGGPAQINPRHYAVRIGTPLESFIEPAEDDVVLLRGGLLNGVPAGERPAGAGYDDDAFFSLPRVGKRELLGFVRPGFNRTSYTRTFASGLSGSFDRHITATLRGEVRACISCGLCETICPAGIMPQVIHRYLYRERIEEAEKAGLDRCVDCNLCTYVCPSKIELQQQFSAAKEFIRKEREEMLVVASRAGGGEGVAEEAP